MRPSPSRSSHSSHYAATQSARTSRQTTKGIAEFLRADDKLASILPAATRMAALQQDCAAALPAMFDACAILQFAGGQLVISTPNSALSTKLKQQLPKLQEHLLQRGWQVNAIRLKVQVSKLAEKSTIAKQLVLPKQALSALDALNSTLEDSPRNDALKAAISSMLNRHRRAR